MNDKDKLEMALWRLSVLGPLVSARLEYGDRLALFHETSDRLHQRPEGRTVKLSPRTIESWFYAYRHRGLKGLKPSTRSDRGQSRSISLELADLIIRAKQEKPRRSIRRIIRMLERARLVCRGRLSRASVHRLLSERGLSTRPARGPAAERRSFLVEHAGDLWMGDAMHGPPVIAPDGKVRKSYLLSQIDGASRYLPHSYFALGEGSLEHEYGFKQALLKCGRPLGYYVDLGSAYVARSLKLICGELGIHLMHTAPKDCEAKGAIERFHRTWREEVGDELPESMLTLEQLNAVHWAWLASEYHARVHTTTGRAPKEHWLDHVHYLRSLPRGVNVDEIFWHRAPRKVRKDATVRFRGRFFEVRAELVGKTVELRYDPADSQALPKVFQNGRFVCDSVPLDRYKNASRHRRRNLGEPDPQVQPTGLDPLDLIEREHYQLTRPVKPGRTRRFDDHDHDKED